MLRPSSSPNVHRGVYWLSQRATDAFEGAREKIRRFLNARDSREIVFTRNATEGTNLVSACFGRAFLKAGDEVLITAMEHHSNIVPWQMLRDEKRCKLRVIPCDERGVLLLHEYRKLLSERTRLVAVTHVSNAVGTVNPVKKLTQMAHEAGALVYIDAVQYAPHGPIDVQDIGCDFLVCSSYKFFGPHAGALYGKYDLLNELKPYQVRPASDELPHKFETGTQNHEGIAGVLGALEYLQWLGTEFGADQAQAWKEAGFSGRTLELKMGMSAMQAYEKELSKKLIGIIQSIPGTHIHGVTDLDRLDERVPTVSFTVEGKDRIFPDTGRL